MHDIQSAYSFTMCCPHKRGRIEDVLCPSCSYINGNVQSNEEKTDTDYSISVGGNSDDVGGNSDDLPLEESGDEVLVDNVPLDISKCLFHSILNVC